MSYIKYKEITKYFNFSKNLDLKDLPWYSLDYVFEDEKVLVAYKTKRDHGVFTNKKMVLFDNTNMFNLKKQITIIPYKSISSCSIIYMKGKTEISLFLDSGYPLRLKFINTKKEEKSRLRNLFSCISMYANNQNETSEKENILIENKFNKVEE